MQGMCRGPEAGSAECAADGGPGQRVEGYVSVRYYGGTQIARFRGQTASCTASYEGAANAVVRKALGDQAYRLRSVKSSMWKRMYEVRATAKEGVA